MSLGDTRRRFEAAVESLIPKGFGTQVSLSQQWGLVTEIVTDVVSGKQVALTEMGDGNILPIPFGQYPPTVGRYYRVNTTDDGTQWIKALGAQWCKTWTLDAEFTAPGTVLDAFMMAQDDQLQLTVLPAGDGRDGAYTQSTTGPIPGCAPQPVVGASTGSFTVPNDMSLNPGDKVLLHSSICSTFSGDVSNVGYWQLVDIVSQFTGGGVTNYFTTQAVNWNQLSGADGRSFAQAQKVKQFTTVSIAAGNAIRPSWAFNDTVNFGVQASMCGGIVAFMHTGTLFGPGTVDASGFGMQGGHFAHQCGCHLPPGEALSGWSGWGASTDLDGGGVPYKQTSTHGGGMGGFCGDHQLGDCCPNNAGFSPSGGAGGGGMVTSGTAGVPGTVSGTLVAGGGGSGGINPYANNVGVALLGSGGGGSGTNPVGGRQGTGARGGGVILVWGNSVATALRANAAGIPGGQGGGGCGGSVRLYYLPGAGLGSASLFADGSPGGFGVNIGGQIHYGEGGNGGQGSIQMFQITPRDGCWESEVVSAINIDPTAAPGTLLDPTSYLSNWLLDSDGIYPRFQLLSSDTGDFTGEETTYPAVGEYYQHGTAHTINSGSVLALGLVAAEFWRLRMCLDSGSNVGDTPSVQDMKVCGGFV